MIIGVIAGTPIDTQMGIDYVNSNGYKALGFACSKNAFEQNEMQVMHKDELLQIAINGCIDMIKNGAEGIYVYCNSLSGAIDINALRQSVSVDVVTPLDVYKICAKNYNRLAVIAANGQSLAAIEKTILSENPQCVVFGAGLLPVVTEIESNDKSQNIYNKFLLKSLTDSFTAIGCDAIILGCTHFPYIENEIRCGVSVDVINPSDKMLRLLAAKHY